VRPPAAPGPAPVAPPAPPAADELRPQLRELAASLRRHSFGAKDQLDELRARLGADPRLLRIEELLDRVQFGEAEAALRALAEALGSPLE